MVFESVGIILSVASLSKDIYDLVKKDDHLNEINKAYQNALKKWCKNDTVREKISSRFLNFSDLVNHIQENGQSGLIDNEYASFLEVWESELRNNALTYGFLTEILARQTVGIGRNLLLGQETIVDKVDGVGEGVKQVLVEVQQLSYQLSKATLVPTTKTLPISNLFTPPQYCKPEEYIRRKVRDFNNVDHLTRYLNPQMYQPQSLIDYLIEGESKKRAILYSEAQAGKSTELKNLAYETQASGLFNVYFYELKSYTGGRLLNDSHLAYFTTDSLHRNMLILDGLDEVKDELRPDAIHQIEYLASEYANLSIVVSCRGNFEGSNEITGFMKLYLNQLDFDDVKVYIEAHCTKPTQLLRVIEEKELYNLVYNPFYLISIVDFYKEKDVLPETKPRIYDYVIEKSLEIDQRKGRGSTVLVKDIALPLLEKIAFCMQFTEHLSLTYTELTQGLSLSDKDIIACTKYTIFKMDTEGNYSFTHNAFKEYLTAKHLLPISFDNLKAAICYPNTDILRPNLYNTVVLLVSILKEDDPLVTQLIEWLAEHKPEVLFMCEHNFLNEDRSVVIFKGYLGRLKKYGEYISYQLWEKTMAFSNNRDAILYLFDEAKKEIAPSCHFSNTITLLQFADLVQLLQSEQDDLYEFGLNLIDKHKDNKDIQHLMFHIQGNNHFKTSTRIAQLYSVIKNCNNPLLLNEFFGLVQSAELSDDYVDWIISKREDIRDYHSNGTTHIVRKEPLIDALASVKTIDSIIKVLGQFDFVSGIRLDGDKRSELISRVFANLHKVPPVVITDKHINDLLALLKSETLTNFFRTDTLSEIVKGYRDFFFNRGYDEIIFTQYYVALKGELLSPKLNDADRNDFSWRCLNILSTLMTEERFGRVMRDSELSEDLRFWWIMGRLGSYEIIRGNDEWNSEIESLKAKYQPQIIDHTKKTQDGFDILFEYEKFQEEINAVGRKYETISSGWEQRVKLWQEDHIDESVSNFIWHYGEQDDRKEIVIAEVVKKATNNVIFNEFLFQQLDNYLRQKVDISEEQLARISTLISDWVDNIDKCKNIHLLARLIDAHNVELNDKQLLSLLPYSYAITKSSTPATLFDDKVDGSLLRYIHDKISNTKLVDSEIDRILSNNEHLSPPLFLKFADYIVYKSANLPVQAF